MEQDRVRMEAEAVKAILSRIERGVWIGVKSSVVDFEIRQMPDPDRMLEVGLMVGKMRESIMPIAVDRKRALILEGLGFHAFDAAHLSCAERAEVDVFLTTDDALLRRASRLRDKLRIEVANPLAWFEKVVKK